MARNVDSKIKMEEEKISFTTRHWKLRAGVPNLLGPFGNLRLFLATTITILGGNEQWLYFPHVLFVGFLVSHCSQNAGPDMALADEAGLLRCYGTAWLLRWALPVTRHLFHSRLR